MKNDIHTNTFVMYMINTFEFTLVNVLNISSTIFFQCFLFFKQNLSFSFSLVIYENGIKKCRKLKMVDAFGKKKGEEKNKLKSYIDFYLKEISPERYF